MDKKIEVICDDREYAEFQGFSETEHGVWCMRSTLDNYNRYQMVKCEENSDAKEFKELDEVEFVKTWRIYAKEVGI